MNHTCTLRCEFRAIRCLECVLRLDPCVRCHTEVHEPAAAGLALARSAPANPDPFHPRNLDW